MWELDYKERWAPKNWCFWTVVLEKTLESPLACKEIKPVNPKGNQPLIFIGRTDAKAQLQSFGHLMQKTNSLEKNPNAGKDWREEAKGTIEDAILACHHQFVEHEFEQAQGAGDGQGSLACCSPCGCKDLDRAEQLNWTDWIFHFVVEFQFWNFCVVHFQNVCLLSSGQDIILILNSTHTKQK